MLYQINLLTSILRKTYTNKEFIIRNGGWGMIFLYWNINLKNYISAYLLYVWINAWDLNKDCGVVMKTFLFNVNNNYYIHMTSVLSTQKHIPLHLRGIISLSYLLYWFIPCSFLVLYNFNINRGENKQNNHDIFPIFISCFFLLRFYFCSYCLFNRIPHFNKQQ